MDELQISGKRYISSRRVAKENGYHTDYIGQLIRANKIKGQKVGRTWYVEADSFAAYLGQEPAAPQELAEQKSSDLLSGASSSHEASAGQTFAQQVPATHIPSVAPEPAPIIAEAPVSVTPPSPAPVTVAPGYIPSAPIATTPIAVAVAHSTPPIAEQKVYEEDSLETKINLRRTAPVGSGLRYVADEPLLPEIPRSERITRVMPTLEDASAETFAPEQAPTRAVVPMRRPMRALALIGAAGVAVFIFSAAMSSGLFQTINIEAGNPASVGYSLNW